MRLASFTNARGKGRNISKQVTRIQKKFHAWATFLINVQSHFPAAMQINDLTVPIQSIKRTLEVGNFAIIPDVKLAFRFQISHI
jgi:hypothetical protein